MDYFSLIKNANLINFDLDVHDLKAENGWSITHSFCYFADDKMQRKLENKMLWNNVQSIMFYCGMIANGYKAIIILLYQKGEESYDHINTTVI